MAKKLGSEKRADGAKWTSKHVGLSDFKEDHKLRLPGSFEKGVKPPMNSTDENAKNIWEG